jgi:hypothetical protein
MTGKANTTTDQAEPDESPSSERSVDPLRDEVLPLLLAAAVMFAVWWAWRETVVEVGAQAVQRSPAPATRSGRN